MAVSKQQSYFFTQPTNDDTDDPKFIVFPDIAQVWAGNFSNNEHGHLFCQLMLLSIQTYQDNQYHFFDAHTTSNCCHGMALRVKKILGEIKKIDLRQLKLEIETELITLKNIENIDFYAWILQFHPAIIELTSFYTLTYCKEEFLNVGRKTKPKKLKKIGNVGIDFCNRTVQSLQKHYSNLVAQSYWQYLQPMKNKIHINGLPIETWGEYVSPQHLRKNQYDILYAPCLYSMQVSLAHLIYTQSKIAIISDVIESEQRIKRYVRIFQGNGKTGFNVLSPHQEDVSEVVIVFGGCSYASDMPLEDLMEPWLSNFPSLVLACDLYYPQFPPLVNDSTFDSTPISPEHPIKEILEKHGTIEGVSAQNASLFCLTHIYPASLKSILDVIEGRDDAIPNFFIPFEVINKSKSS